MTRMNSKTPIQAKDIKGSGQSIYPEPYASMMKGRYKRKLGDFFGLQNFGINLTELSPGSISALKHHHLKQDEFIYIISGNPTLILNSQEFLMSPGDCFGFKAGEKSGSQLKNNTNILVEYLEIGDRISGDIVEYPDDDIRAEDTKQGWMFTHKNGTKY